MTSTHISFESFEGGERGLFDDFKPIPSSFRAVNLLKNMAGELMVRPGLQNITPSGYATTGKVWAFGATSHTNANRFFVQGTAVKTFVDGGTSLQSVVATLDSTPAEACPYVEGDFIYFSNRGDGIYKLDCSPTPPVLTKLTGAPGGRALAIYGSRLVTANYDDAFPYRIRFSDENDFNSWPAENFIDVDNAFQIGGLFVQNNHLTIMKQESFWALYGVPGVNDTLRKVIRMNGGLNQFAGAVGYLDEIAFHGLGMRTPGLFNGVKAINKHNLQYGVTTAGTPAAQIPEIGVFAVRAMDEGFVLIDSASNQAATLLQDTWTYHTFGVDVSGMGTNIGNIDNVILTTDGGGTSIIPKFYVWYPTAMTPGIEGSGSMRAGDDSATALSGTLTMPEYWQDNFRGSGNKEFHVSKVIIDFRSYNTGSSTHNHFDLQVKAMRVDDAQTFTSATQSWDEASSSSSASGTVRRVVFTPEGLPYGNGFQLLLTNIRGIAIQGFQILLNPSVEKKP